MRRRLALVLVALLWRPVGASADWTFASTGRPPEAFSVWELRLNADRALGQQDGAQEAARALMRVARTRQQRTVASGLVASLAATTTARERAPSESTNR